MIERWLEIKKYPRYAVSSHGRIMNIQTGRILKPNLTTPGYLQVQLCDLEGKHPIGIHRLVAIEFFDVEFHKFEVNHIDGDKTNNHIWNLEVGTSSDNRQHAYDTGLRDSHKRAVKCLETGETFSSMAEADRYFNLGRGSVSAVIYGDQKSAGGLHFERSSI